ncbi:hypothetical protein ILYODFUR_001330 [Ilyodon furcidens]|uniref:Secreted protein n=1 Tax=Ilyodon furcidens TaxID=33524 RepID=A0ABV0UED6_9TELE
MSACLPLFLHPPFFQPAFLSARLCSLFLQPSCLSLKACIHSGPFNICRITSTKGTPTFRDECCLSQGHTHTLNIHAVIVDSARSELTAIPVLYVNPYLGQATVEQPS